MDWLKKMNAALDYIEKNLIEYIDFSIVAQKACCSSYNFQRMFSFITDVPLAEYIRRRRLTQAALELQNSNTKVIDVALKYGYESPVSFSRAFANIHGITPNEAKQSGAELKAYPKISFQISIKGEKEMNYRIEKKEDFDVFGIETVASLSGEDGFVSSAELWQQSHQKGDYERLFNASGDLPKFISQDLCKFPSEKFKWDEDFKEVLRNLQKRFYSEWLPTANYERVAGANLEIYGGDREYGYIELWFPVKEINITK